MKASPPNQSINELYSKFKMFIQRASNSMYKESIVLIDSKTVMPQTIRNVVVCAVYAGLFTLFIYFTVEKYNVDRNNKFISLESDSGECTSVTKPLTGTFLASTSGLWEGQLGFNYTQALYSFQFSNATFEGDDYENFMVTVKYSLLSAGNFSRYANLATNLMYLVAASTPLNVNGNIQYVQLTGAPSTIFNRQYITATLVMGSSVPGGHYSGCNASYYDVIFNPALSKFQLSYDLIDFNQADCNTILNLDQFVGYIPSVQSSIVMDIDMITFSIAWALNFGMINPVELEEIVPSVGEALYIEFRSVSFIYKQYYDIRYPSMTPIGCIFNAETLSFFFCVVEMSATFVLPIINPYSGQYDQAQPCTCESSATNTPYCNIFNFLVSVLFANQPSTESVFDCILPLMEMYLPYLENSSTTYNAYEHLNNDAYFAQYYSTDAEYLQQNNALSFCGFNCSMLTIAAGDEYNQATSVYYYQLLNGSCSNLFESTNWQELIATSPLPLVESYYSCQMKREPAISDALGISFANVSLIMFLVPYGFFPILFLLLHWFGKEKEDYNDEDRLDALKLLADELLRCRDHRKSYSGQSKEQDDVNMEHVIKYIVRSAAESQRSLNVSADKQQIVHINPIGVELQKLDNNSQPII